METPTETIVEIAAVLRLSESDHRKVLGTKQDVGRVANYLLEQYAKGGVLLRFGQVQYLSGLANQPIRVGDDVLQIVESGVNRHTTNGNLSINYVVDSAFAEPLEQLAIAQSRPVDAIVQEACAAVFTNSWLYDLKIDGGTLHLTKAMREDLEKVMGDKMLTGEKVTQWVKDNAPKPPQRAGKTVAQVRERLAEIEVLTEGR